MDHLPEWADFPCPYSLQEEPTLGENDEESRFTPRVDRCSETSEQMARDFFKESHWSWNHQNLYGNWDNYSADDSFGDLPHTDASTRCYHLRLNRGFKGPEHPNIQRSNEAVHEKAKFNILRNPTEYHKRMEPWDRSDLRKSPTELEKAAEKLHWCPQEANRPTNAPLQLCPGHKFKKPKNGQDNCAFAKFMLISELREAVADLLPYEDLSSVSRTSQVFFQSIESSFTHWDTTNRFFGNANISSGDLEALREAGGQHAEKEKSITKEGLAPLNRVIVSPVRTDEGRSFRQHMNTLQHLFRAIALRGRHMRYLQLHRVEFLNVEAIEQMVDCMPNLKRLSVLQCPLVHFGHTRRLVDITARANEARGPGKHMDLDFYPKAYLGPVHDRCGSHHVIFQDDGQIDTRRAVVACLTTLIPYARKHGVELAMPSRAFRLWLDGFPFKYGTLEKILESIDNLEYHTPEEEQRMTNKAWEEGRLRDDAEEVAMRRRLQDALHYDLFIATMGKPQPKRVMESLQYSRCSLCGKGLLAPFFRQGPARAHERACHGCDLLEVLDRQYNHFLEMRNALAATIWRRNDVNCLADLVAENTARGRVAAKAWDFTLKCTRILDALALDGSNVPPYFDIRRHRTIYGVQHQPPNARPMAACWDRERRDFNLLLQTERGFIVDHGPYVTHNPQKWL